MAINHSPRIAEIMVFNLKPGYIHQKTVNIVCAQVPDAAEGNRPPFPVRHQKQTKIKAGDPEGVQRVKPNAATAGIKNRICE
jgi:hypothetical protein